LEDAAVTIGERLGLSASSTVLASLARGGYSLQCRSVPSPGDLPSPERPTALRGYSLVAMLLLSGVVNSAVFTPSARASFLTVGFRTGQEVCSRRASVDRLTPARWASWAWVMARCSRNVRTRSPSHGRSPPIGICVLYDYLLTTDK